tara:strand:+ start:35737 stop:36216 length:480 start_codon:yes stop_codon:yes gene_type:complete
VVWITLAHVLADHSRPRGFMKRSLLRWIARCLVGVLLFGQLAIAAYACPALHPGVIAAEQGARPPAAAHDAQATSTSNFFDSMGVGDPASPNLCAEHCKAGDQSGHAPSIVVPVAWPVALYESPARPPIAPAPRPTADSLSDLVAASPPHAILHCVRRT